MARQQLDDTPRRKAYLALVTAAEALVEEFRRLFQSHGLTPTQFNVLRLLLTGADEGETCSALKAGLMHRVPDVTRLVDRMERDGLVARGRSARDRRVVLVRITAEGRRRAEALYPAVMRLHEQQFPDASDAELARTERVLRRAAEAATTEDA